MSSTKALLVSLLATPLLTQCLVVDETGSAIIAPPTDVSSGPARTQSVHELGYQKGLEDGRGGGSRNPQRHAGTYPSGDSDAFNMGYEKGYNQGIR